MRFSSILLSLFVCFSSSLFSTDSSLIPIQVLFGNPEKALPTLAPDGTKLSYVAPLDGVLNIWIKTIGQDDDQALTKDTNRGIANHMWTHDSKYIIYTHDKNGKENSQIYKLDLETKEITQLTPDNVKAGIAAYSKNHPTEALISMNKENPAFFDVYHLDIVTGKYKLIEKNPGTFAGYYTDDELNIRAASHFLPDGSVEVFLKEQISSEQISSEQISSEKDSWKPFMSWGPEDNMSTGIISFTKNNSVYMSDSTNANTTRFVEIDLATKEKKIIAEDPEYDIANIAMHPDTQKPLWVTFLKEKKERVLLDQEYAEDFETLKTFDQGECGVAGFTNDFSKWTVVYYSDIHAPRWWLYDRNTKKATFLFSTKPELDKYPLQEMHPISFKSRDKLTIHGYITYPQCAEHNKLKRNLLPLVLLVHGGPWSRDNWDLNPDAQFLANRGYACLQVNFRGSAGFGKAFLNAGDKEWGRAMHNDLIDTVNWAVSQGIADPKRVAIMGASYGGYASLCGAAFTPDVFCCAIDLFGISNLLTRISEAAAYLKTILPILYKRMGNPITERKMLIERSPLFSANKIKCPILVAQGENDVRCTKVEADQIVKALKDRTIPCEYLLFENEGHGLAMPKNRLTLLNSIERFLAQHLGGQTQSDVTLKQAPSIS